MAEAPLEGLRSAYRAGRLLLVWGCGPFVPSQHGPSRVTLLRRWRAAAWRLGPVEPLLLELAPAPILSLDPSTRLDTALGPEGAGRLLALAGNLASGSELLLTWADVHQARTHERKRATLTAAAAACAEGAVLLLDGEGGTQLGRLWQQLLAPWLLAPAFALGPGPWPPSLTPLPERPAALLAALRGAGPTRPATARPAPQTEGRSDADSGGAPVHPEPPTPRPAPLSLALTLEPAAGGATVRWASVLGKQTSRLAPPYRSEDLRLVLRALDYLQSSKGHEGFSAAEVADLERLGLAAEGYLSRDAPRTVGRRLFAALTADAVAAEMLRTACTVATKDGVPLALSLHLPVDAGDLAALPWELLWDQHPEPLLIRLGRGSSLTRHLDLDTALPPTPPGGRSLRVLPVLPEAGQGDEERDAEVRVHAAIWRRLREEGRVEILPELRPATRELLFDTLDELDRPPDIVHFFGRGRFKDGVGHLILDRPGGGWDPTPVSLLAAQLKGVRLAVLAGCESATVAQGQGQAPAMLHGVAPAVSAAGVPLVVGLQLSLRTVAAYRLVEVLYRNLALGHSVQEALSRARHGLYATESDGSSWYVPVLYVRAREQGPIWLT